jgi:hypothetical protein
LYKQTGFLYSISSSARGNADIFEKFMVEQAARLALCDKLAEGGGGKLLAQGRFSSYNRRLTLPTLVLTPRWAFV